MADSKRTRYAEEIQRRLIALDLPNIGNKVYLRAVPRDGPGSVKPCLIIKRGPKVDTATQLVIGNKFLVYSFQVMAKMNLGDIAGSDEQDHWYEQIEDAFHGQPWDQTDFYEVYACTVEPSEPQRQEDTEYQLMVNGCTINVFFHKPMPTPTEV